jgi:CheY-like chemotaxis protein
LNGIDLSRVHSGDVIDVSDWDARVLIAEGWAEAVNAPGRRAPVLIVEDDDATRTMVAEWVRQEGYDAVEARDGREGLAALIGHRPAVVLLDLGMPRMNGPEFRRAQWQLPDAALARVPVVVVSGLDDAEEQAARLGASGVVHKPIAHSELVATLAHEMPH